MKNDIRDVKPRIYFEGLVTVLLALIPSLIIFSKFPSNGLIAGISVIFYLLMSKKFSRTVLKISERKKSKAYMDFITTISLFLIVGSLALTAIIPKYLAILVIGLPALTLIINHKLNKRYRKKINLDIGERVWIIWVALIFITSGFNSYIIFYGAILLLMIMFYDLISMIYNSWK